MTEFIKYPIKHRVFIKKSPDVVYETITSGKGWNAFFTQATEVDPRPNGKIVFRWKDWGPDFYNSNADGKVHKAEKPSLFAFEWYPIGKEFPTNIELKLTEKFGGTVVELSETGYPSTDAGQKMILECAGGWAEALTLLKFYLEFGVVYTPPVKDN